MSDAAGTTLLREQLERWTTAGLIEADQAGRIEAAEEAAAFDRPVKYTRWGPTPWVIDSEIIGKVRQDDIPQMITDELAKAAVVTGGIKALTTALNLSTSKSLKDYASGTYKMPYAVGQRFVRYLEERAKKSGAAPAATDATPKSKATEEAPAPIVPQPAQNDKTADLQARIAELEVQNAELKTALDTATAKLASVQGREMSELEDEVETLRRRVAHYEADDAACGPARVEELEDQLSRARDEHVRDLELIRDLTRQLVARSAC
jgi:hypothetical protein